LVQNPRLTSVAALDGAIAGSIQISGNEALTSLDGLGAPANAVLYITDNPSLTNLDGLESVTRLGLLSIHDNAALGSLRGLGNLTAIEGGLAIRRNVSLPTCEAWWLRDAIGVADIGGPIVIELNDDEGTCP
jgi:hypothetical protein